MCRLGGTDPRVRASPDDEDKARSARPADGTDEWTYQLWCEKVAPRQNCWPSVGRREDVYRPRDAIDESQGAPSARCQWVPMLDVRSS